MFFCLPCYLFKIDFCVGNFDSKLVTFVIIAFVMINRNLENDFLMYRLFSFVCKIRSNFISKWLVFLLYSSMLFSYPFETFTCVL